jgi:hypothetical protein
MATQISSKNVKSYATEANLTTALAKFTNLSVRHLVCKTIEDRWTAVFICPGGKGVNEILGTGFMMVG